MAENTNTQPSINSVLKESLGNLQSLVGPDAVGDKNDAVATLVDYKMVTFSLAGKDYAIDIMKVKEIQKAGRFTYVPNALPFVLGVYNLRGEIIPIVDLRLFFNIEVPERKFDAIENMLIVSVGDQTFGVVVDDIDKVVGIQKSTINPPHPLFGDINIKYIQGVVEVNNRLYVLLDIERIFGSKQEAAEASKPGSTASTVANDSMSKIAVQTTQKSAAQKIAEAKAESKVVQESKETKTSNSVSVEQKVAQKMEQKVVKAEKIDYSFIVEGLASFKKFFVTALNENWMQCRYEDWESERGKSNTQLQNVNDADDFLKPFFSENTGTWWNKEYADSIVKVLPDNSAKQIVVWNPGCGKGYETYSFACILKKRYPDSKIKVYAHETDLLSISNAPLLSVPADVANDWYSPYVSKKANGEFTFSQEIRDSILFEYHDCSNTNALPPVDIVLARDVLSFLSADAQKKISEDFAEKLKGNGIAVVGQNEALDKLEPTGKWIEQSSGSIAIFSKK